MTLEVNQNGKLHLNPNLILRDCELFHRKNGFGFYKTEICQRLTGEVQTGNEPRDIWLPSETAELRLQAEQHQSTIIVGQLGAGKSALMYGLRSGDRQQKKTYLYVDGHFISTSPRKTSAAFDWATKNSAPVYWDSFDYLAAGTRRVRKTPVERHRQRSLAIIDLVEQFLNSDGLFIATSHSEPWLNAYGDQELIEGPWGEVINKLKRHDVKGRFETPAELEAFYTSAGMSRREAIYMSSLCQNSKLTEFFIRSKSDQNVKDAYGEQAIDEAIDSIKSYRLSKLIALDPTSLELRSALSQMTNGQLTEDRYINILGRYIFDKNHQTKVKMGIIAA